MEGGGSDGEASIPQEHVVPKVNGGGVILPFLKKDPVKWTKIQQCQHQLWEVVAPIHEEQPELFAALQEAIQKGPPRNPSVYKAEGRYLYPSPAPATPTGLEMAVGKKLDDHALRAQAAHAHNEACGKT